MQIKILKICKYSKLYNYNEDNSVIIHSQEELREQIQK